jgi:hypothetical protein
MQMKKAIEKMFYVLPVFIIRLFCCQKYQSQNILLFVLVRIRFPQAQKALENVSSLEICWKLFHVVGDLIEKT